MRTLCVNLALLLAICSSGVGAQEVPGCGNLKNPTGPFDYRDTAYRETMLPLVENHHFTPQVETLRSGQSGALDLDLDYTLRAFPNHHRALNAVSRYELSGGRFSDRTIPSADCFFRRAVEFRSDDETVCMLYGNYLYRKGQRAAAKAQYDRALQIAPTNPEVNYNAALFYVAEGDIIRAKELAKVAYDAGYPLPGLRNKIEEYEARHRR